MGTHVRRILRGMRPGIAPVKAVIGLLALFSLGVAVVFVGVHVLESGSAATGPRSRPRPTAAPEVLPPDTPGDPETDTHACVKGMTISCQSWGWEWGTDDMVRSMEDLKALGVNWIAIHPYASIRDDGTVAWRYGRRGPAAQPKGEVPDWLTRPINEAHDLGLKIMIKPHLAYWGSGFSWRGDIKFSTDEQWERFFETYGSWAAELAGICSNADAFVVGTEIDATVAGHDAQWRQIIARVRGQFPNGVLTYAANWNTYTDVSFWDALDVIGIQAYFPLMSMPDGVQLPGAVEHWRERHATVPDVEKYIEPTKEQVAAAWARIMVDLHKASAKYGRRIVFTELGYNCSLLAPYVPWDSRMVGRPTIEESEVRDHPAERVQVMCMTAALEAIEAHDDVVCGAFLWKWFPGSRPYGDFAMASEALQNVIKEEWGE